MNTTTTKPNQTEPKRRRRWRFIKDYVFGLISTFAVALNIFNEFQLPSNLNPLNSLRNGSKLEGS